MVDQFLVEASQMMSQVKVQVNQYFVCSKWCINCRIPGNQKLPLARILILQYTITGCLAGHLM